MGWIRASVQTLRVWLAEQLQGRAGWLATVITGVISVAESIAPLVAIPLIVIAGIAVEVVVSRFNARRDREELHDSIDNTLMQIFYEVALPPTTDERESMEDAATRLREQIENDPGISEERRAVLLQRLRDTSF